MTSLIFTFVVEWRLFGGRAGAWGLSMVFLAVVVIIAGQGLTGRYDGAFINSQNRISLSQLQIILWTLLILSAIATTASSRIREAATASGEPKTTTSFSAALANGANARVTEAKALADQTAAVKTGADKLAADSRDQAPPKSSTDAARTTLAGDAKTLAGKAGDIKTAADQASVARTAEVKTLADQIAAAKAKGPLDFDIPQELWVVMGISLASAGLSPIILKNNKEKPVSIEDTVNAQNKAAASGKETISVAGQVVVRNTPADARWSDLFEGEEPANLGHLDVTRLQNLFLTLTLIFVYGSMLYSLFSETALITGLPAFSTGMVTLLGISHAAYLTTKALTPGATPNDSGRSPVGGIGPRQPHLERLEPVSAIAAKPVAIFGSPELAPAGGATIVYFKSKEGTEIKKSDTTPLTAAGTIERTGKVTFSLPTADDINGATPAFSGTVQVGIKVGGVSSDNTLSLTII